MHPAFHEAPESWHNLVTEQYKWYHMIFLFLFLSQFDNLQVLPCCCKWHCFIVSYGWVIVHCIYVPHLLYPFICQQLFSLLPCLSIVNTAAMNTGVHISFWIRVLSGYMSRSEVAGSYGNSTSSFLRNLHMFSTGAVPTYIPTNSAGGCSFFHTFSSICYL